MISAAEVRRFIAEIGKKPRKARKELARVIGDVAPRGQQARGGVRAHALRAQSAIGDKERS